MAIKKTDTSSKAQIAATIADENENQRLAARSIIGLYKHIAPADELAQVTDDEESNLEKATEIIEKVKGSKAPMALEIQKIQHNITD
jgi:hypothetical protein